MTDRINALTVVLDRDVRDDEAIMHLRHVIKVEKNVSNIDTLVAEARARRNLTTKILALIKEG